MTSISERVLSALGGSYTIERELHGGGMARVFVGDDKDLDRKVVIKILPAEMAASVSAERFRREILTVARLQHPHIVPILKAGEVDGIPYFVMPYVDGESIDLRLRRTHTFGVRETLGILKDVARALAFAHDRGVVHRDIKPGNILLASGSATVTDFGVAKALTSALRSGESRPSGLTNTGMSLGTILYMAPEQAAGDPEIDGRADIYSLGITAYEMLSGAAPFATLNPREMLTARLTLPPPPLSTVRKDVPAGLERLIARCLAIDPDDRIQTASALVEALEDPEVISGSFASTGPRRAHRGRRVKAAVVGALALVGAVAVSAGIYTRTHPNTAAAESTTVAPAQASLGVVAILPFVNLGVDSSNAYLATGVTNAVAGKLMKTAGLRVLAPGRPRSVKRWSDTAASATVAATMVLEGTVERIGNRLRVTARLSNTDDDVMQWADVYDRDVKDVFTVEDEIADAIVASVKPMTGRRQPS
jgi:eukaryotic-like serine/threonine-protein kinase